MNNFNTTSFFSLDMKFIEFTSTGESHSVPITIKFLGMADLKDITNHVIPSLFGNGYIIQDTGENTFRLYNKNTDIELVLAWEVNDCARPLSYNPGAIDDLKLIKLDKNFTKSRKDFGWSTSSNTSSTEILNETNNLQERLGFFLN